MREGADYNEIERFMASRTGKQHLDNIRRTLVNRTVADVQFENNTHNVKTLLVTDNGNRFYCIQPCHDVNVIRELFGQEIYREGDTVSTPQQQGP